MIRGSPPGAPMDKATAFAASGAATPLPRPGSEPPPEVSAGLPVADVVQLLSALGNAQPGVAQAVAQMLQAAEQGKPVQISPAGLGIDPGLLQRVMEAAGGNARQSAEQDVALDNEMRAIYQRNRQPQEQMA